MQEEENIYEHILNIYIYIFFFTFIFNYIDFFLVVYMQQYNKYNKYKI